MVTKNRKKAAADLVVLVSSATIDEATKIAKTVVDARLAACANIVPTVRSIFRWKGELEDCTETLIIFKTTTSCYKRLEDKIKENHSYSVPEVIGFSIDCGSNAYRRWIKNQTSK